MASGKPSGWMRRALGSTVVAIMERVIKMAKIVRHADAKQQKLHKVLSGGGEYILWQVKQHTHRHRHNSILAPESIEEGLGGCGYFGARMPLNA